MHIGLDDVSAWSCNKNNPPAGVLNRGSTLIYGGVLCVREGSCRNTIVNLCQHQGIVYAENSSAPFVDRLPDAVDCPMGGTNPTVYERRG